MRLQKQDGSLSVTAGQFDMSQGVMEEEGAAAVSCSMNTSQSGDQPLSLLLFADSAKMSSMKP